MANDPKFVRLRPGVTFQLDTRSGWSIGGRSVLPFPDSEPAISFAQDRLRKGILEPASQAEREETEDSQKKSSPEPAKSSSKKKAEAKEPSENDQE